MHLEHEHEEHNTSTTTKWYHKQGERVMYSERVSEPGREIKYKGN